jgi:hypothetical protein
VVLPASSGEGVGVDVLRVPTLGDAVTAVLGPIRSVREDLRRATNAGRS